MPYLRRIDTVQAHTEFGAIPCDESHRIPIGYLLDESFDGAVIRAGGKSKCGEENKDEKDGDMGSMVNQ